MLNKIKLFHQIRKFYKIYGEVLNSNFINKLADITPDNLHDVLFDINEVLEANSQCFNEKAYAQDVWLNKLSIQIQKFREDSLHKYLDTIANINAFYNIFWEVLTYGYEFNAQSHFNYDTLDDVVNDINKILVNYEDDETDPIYRWLDTLCDDVARFRDTVND